MSIWMIFKPLIRSHRMFVHEFMDTIYIDCFSLIHFFFFGFISIKLPHPVELILYLVANQIILLERPTWDNLRFPFRKRRVGVIPFQVLWRT